MMLPVLSSETFVYHHMQNLAVVRVMVDSRKYDTSDFAVVHDTTVDNLDNSSGSII